MYLFKKEKKEEVLKGRTIRYLAKTTIPCTEVYLSGVLNGRVPCSYLLSKSITECADKEAKQEDYFIRMEK